MTSVAILRLVFVKSHKYLHHSHDNSLYHSKHVRQNTLAYQFALAWETFTATSRCVETNNFYLINRIGAIERCKVAQCSCLSNGIGKISATIGDFFKAIEIAHFHTGHLFMRY